MKIRIEHTTNPLNYGTNMMVTNFMYYISKEINDIEFVLDVYNDEDLDNYKVQSGIKNIKRETIDYNFSLSKNILEKIKNKLKRELFYDICSKKNIATLMKTTDKLIILGGDDLSEYYGIKPLKREFNRLSKIKEKVDLYIVGQTIGPFSEDNKRIVKECLKDTHIYSRDPWTTKYLENDLNIKDAIDSSDLAFLDLPNQNDKNHEKKILNKYNLEKDEYVTIVPSGLYRSYCDDKEIYIENWLEIIKNISIRFKDKKIVLIGHVLRDRIVDDRNIIKDIQSKLDNCKNIIFIYDEMMPLEARYILGNGVFTITGRMHGAISTFQMKKPAISLSYSVKYDGVIGLGLGLSELIVDGKDKNKWISKDVTNKTIEKIDYLLSNYSDIKDKIDKKTKIAQKNAFEMINDISNNLKR